VLYAKGRGEFGVGEGEADFFEGFSARGLEGRFGEIIGFAWTVSDTARGEISHLGRGSGGCTSG